MKEGEGVELFRKTVGFFPQNRKRVAQESYAASYGEAPPKRGTFLRLCVYERVEISLAEMFKRVRKSVNSVCKKAQKG